MKQDPARLLAGAKALAAICGDAWEGIDSPARAHYQKEAGAVVTALAIYDTQERSRLIKEGHAKSRKAGFRREGRPQIGQAVERLARELILQKATTRTIRDKTGLGNSTISRIKADMEREPNYVPPGAATASDRTAGNLQV